MTEKEAMEIINDLEIYLGRAQCKGSIIRAVIKALESLEKTADKECSRCIDRGRCAIYDNFNIDYCSDWRIE